MISYALQPHPSPPEANYGRVPEAGSGQALHGRGNKVKNEVGALATSIFYQPKAFTIGDELRVASTSSIEASSERPDSPEETEIPAAAESGLCQKIRASTTPSVHS